MRLSKLYFIFSFFALVLGILFACHRDKVEAPVVQTNLSFKRPFYSNINDIDFYDATKSNVYFTAEFSEIVDWRITITGENSLAQKTIEGTSAVIDASNSKWDGSQDSLFYFQCGERCFVTIANIVDIEDNYVTKQLKVRGNLKQLPQIILRDTLTLGSCSNSRQLAKPKQPDLLSLFPENGFDFGDDLYYTVGYDDENLLQDSTHIDIQLEQDHKIVQGGPGTFQCIFAFPLQYSKGGKSITGSLNSDLGVSSYFMLKGKDTTQFCNKENYYIGRLATPTISSKPGKVSVDDFAKFLYNSTQNPQFSVIQKLATTSPDDVYVNVFVYGDGSGSTMNVIVKEDDNYDGSYSDQIDEQYQAQISLNFTGWQLFSFQYSGSGFQYQLPAIGESCNVIKNPQGKSSNKIKEPNHIYLVQFSLVAKDPGGPGVFVIDYPSITLGRPLLYTNY